MSVNSTSENTNDTPQPAELAETADGAASAEATAPPSRPADFKSLGLGEALLATVAEMGFEAPTDVQAAAIPHALEGRDLLVQSRTGSGKTAAFAIPLCDRLIDGAQRVPQALVLAPTRELAQQVARECARITGEGAIKTVAIYGGAAMAPQIDAITAGAQLIVATPGRLLDHIRRKTLDPSAIRFLVLDECDEMLSMGFQEEINAILEKLPSERQTMLFSATIPAEIERMTERHLDDPARILLSQDFVGVREISHVYYLVSGAGRMDDLLHVLQHEKPRAAIVFCNTRDETARVAEYLRGNGIAAEGISSDLSQSERERVMARVRAGDLKFLVATDVAARGIDIADLTHVINYTFPDSADSYVHRTGRTGRAGKSGVAISLVSAKELGSFYFLKLIHRIYPERRHLPTAEETATRREGELYEQLTAQFAGKSPSSQMEGLARRIWSMPRGYQMVALALQELLEGDRPVKTRRSESSASERPRHSSDRGAERRPAGGSRQRGSGRARDGQEARGGRRSEGPGSRRERSPRRGSESGSFTTADGDVEQYETVEPSSAPRSSRDGSTTEGMARLYVNLGRRHKVSSQDLVQFVQIEGGIDPEQIGKVSQLDRHTYVEVQADLAEKLIEQLAGKDLADRPVRVELARPRTRG